MKKKVEKLKELKKLKEPPCVISERLPSPAHGRRKIRGYDSPQSEKDYSAPSYFYLIVTKLS